MKGRINIPSQYKKQVQEMIKEETMEYLDKVKKEAGKRCCYAAILALDDVFRSRFGQKQETINTNYQKFANLFAWNVKDYTQSCFDWDQSSDPEAPSKAMLAELKNRGIEIEFE